MSRVRSVALLLMTATLVMVSAVVAATGPAMAALCVVGVERWDRLNIRSSPGVRTRSIGAIPAGACGVVINGKCKGAWCPVTWQGRSGWANGDYLGRYDRPPTRAERGIRDGNGQSPDRQANRERAAEPQVTAAGNVASSTTPSASVARIPAASAPEQQVYTGLDREKTVVTITPAEPKSAVRSAAMGRTATAGAADEAARGPALPPSVPRASLAETPPVARSGAGQEPGREKIAAVPAAKAAMARSEGAKSASVGRSKAVVASPAIGSEACVKGVGSDETLKVRAGPGQGFALRYGYLPGTCGVKITGACKDGWCPVDYRGYKGWAEARNLQP